MLKFLIEKEFKQIFRHSFIPKMIVGFPIIMLLITPWAANQDIKNIRLSVVDNDHSTLSTRLVNKTVSSGYFLPTDVSSSYSVAFQSVESGEAEAILEIQTAFERNLMKTGAADVMISVNAVNGMKGGLGAQYLTGIVRNFTSELMEQQGIKTRAPTVSTHFKYNQRLDYKVFMLPALMVMLLTLLSGFLPALNIVSEKETGTIEQLNVTPVSKFTFILAKLIPYWIVGYIVMVIGMTIAALVYGLTPAGSLATLFLYSTVYVLVVSGLGLVISNYSSTMQEAMFLIFFFILLLILMSGLFTPVSSMPDWAQAITLFNPLRYFMEVMRSVYLKGSAMRDLLPQLAALTTFAAVFNLWAVLSYRKSS